MANVNEIIKFSRRSGRGAQADRGVLGGRPRLGVAARPLGALRAVRLPAGPAHHRSGREDVLRHAQRVLRRRHRRLAHQAEVRRGAPDHRHPLREAGTDHPRVGRSWPANGEHPRRAVDAVQSRHQSDAAISGVLLGAFGVLPCERDRPRPVHGQRLLSGSRRSSRSATPHTSASISSAASGASSRGYRRSTRRSRSRRSATPPIRRDCPVCTAASISATTTRPRRRWDASSVAGLDQGPDVLERHGAVTPGASGAMPRADSPLAPTIQRGPRRPCARSDRSPAAS